jgi:hypothetical protein
MILSDNERLNLDPHQVRQAETQKKAADGAVLARIPETYQCLLTPGQKTPQSPIEWTVTRLSGADPLAVRAAKKLAKDETLLTTLGATVLRKEMDKIPLWSGNHVSIPKLAEYFSSYLYLPRLVSSKVLTSAIQNGLGSLAWEVETFAYAEMFDESTQRYLGMRCGVCPPLAEHPTGYLVKPSAAKQQIEEDAEKARKIQEEKDRLEREQREREQGSQEQNTTQQTKSEVNGDNSNSTKKDQLPQDSKGIPPQSSLPLPKPKLRRFQATAPLDPQRPGRDASKIADEVIAHLTALVGAKVTITLEIEAHLPEGASEQLVRTVTENCRTLKFTQHAFEQE